MSGATIHVNNEATVKTHLELPLDSWSYTYQILLFFVFGNHWAKKKKKKPYLLERVEKYSIKYKFKNWI